MEEEAFAFDNCVWFLDLLQTFAATATAPPSAYPDLRPKLISGESFSSKSTNYKKIRIWKYSEYPTYKTTETIAMNCQIESSIYLFPPN